MVLLYLTWAFLSPVNLLLFGCFAASDDRLRLIGSSISFLLMIITPNKLLDKFLF